MTKLSSKVLLFSPTGGLYAVYRSLGPWNNPGTVSLIGTDGETLEGVIEQVAEKLLLNTTPQNWDLIAQAKNEEGDELNFVWQLNYTIEKLWFNPKAYGGVFCLPPHEMWSFEQRSMLSPSARSVMKALPKIFPKNG